MENLLITRKNCPPAEVQAAAENWRDQILSAISQPDQPPYTPWPEDNEKPYYTDKPDWDTFGAMLLVAACHTYDEPVPPTVGNNWNFGEHPRWGKGYLLNLQL